MANLATINTLETIIRARLNLTNLATVSSADMKLFIHSALNTLYEKIINKHRDYYVIPFKFSLVANQDQYPLPADFHTDICVWLMYGTAPYEQRQVLEQFTINRYHNLALTINTAQWPVLYRLMGNDIWLTPTPSAAAVNAIEMLYVPQWKAPVSDDVSIDVQLPNGWESWVEYDVCVQVAMRMRQPEYYAMYKAERDEREKVVMAGVSVRDEQPQYMTDSYSQTYYTLDTPGEV